MATAVAPALHIFNMIVLSPGSGGGQSLWILFQSYPGDRACRVAPCRSDLVSHFLDRQPKQGQFLDQEASAPTGESKTLYSNDLPFQCSWQPTSDTSGHVVPTPQSTPNICANLSGSTVGLSNGNQNSNKKITFM